MMLHRVACSMVLQRRAAAARELYPTSPAYRSRPRPSAGRSRRVRLLIWAQRVASSRLRPSDGTLYRGALEAAPAHAAPRHPGPCAAIWRAVRCPGPPGQCLGTARHLAGRVWRAYGSVPAHLFVVYNKAVQKSIDDRHLWLALQRCVGSVQQPPPPPVHDSSPRPALSGLGAAHPARVRAHGNLQQNTT